ncbi:MAG: penicillin-binding protein, partial [Paludibacteraceae bacterium]|nr:penicillin-binding protein [Paludibacteraceae bacterium]
GGEYRSIHFRNGDLGQGSRAALPIVGLFLEKVLNDNVLSAQYRARFGAPKCKIKKEFNCKPIEEEIQADTTESAMRGFFRRLFGRDDSDNVSDSTKVHKSRRELRRERREKRRERRRR